MAWKNGSNGNRQQPGPAINKGGKNGGNKNSARHIYAGSYKDWRQRTSPANPWTPYTLPKRWVPVHVLSEWKTGTHWAQEQSTIVPIEKREAALATLKAAVHSPSDRRRLPNAPPMWKGLVTACEVEAAMEQWEDVGMVTFAPTSTSASASSASRKDKGKKERAKARAVAIDTQCVETGFGKGSGRSSLAWLGVVDFLSGEVLLDVLVLPDHPVTAWRKVCHGLDHKAFHEARRRGNLVQGVKGAQDALFQVIDRDTIIVGHSLMNDQRALYLAHDHAYDVQGACGKKGCSLRLHVATPFSFDFGAHHRPAVDSLAIRELALDLLGLRAPDCWPTMGSREDDEDPWLVGSASDHGDSSPGTLAERMGDMTIKDPADDWEHVNRWEHHQCELDAW